MTRRSRRADKVYTKSSLTIYMDLGYRDGGMRDEDRFPSCERSASTDSIFGRPYDP